MLPFPAKEDSYTTSTVEHYLSICAGQLLTKRETSQDAPLSPLSVTLLFRPISQTSDFRLLRMFFKFFRCVQLLPIPNNHNWWNENHNSHVAVENTIKNCPRFDPVKRRDAVFLPLENFHINTKGRTLGDHFFESLRTKRYGHYDPAPITRTKVVNGSGTCTHGEGWFFQDARALTFPHNNPHEPHGIIREFAGNSSHDIEVKLGQIYRFGIPIEDGLHYDVCHSRLGNLEGIEFKCCKNGIVRATGGHINIYPNDFIRK